MLQALAIWLRQLSARASVRVIGHRETHLERQVLPLPQFDQPLRQRVYSEVCAIPVGHGFQANEILCGLLRRAIDRQVG